ncbi:hypothetical protein NM688_g5645 [Phlebia brevispora]|uniref:Uncharacterized protein n=1 Tax=Phlebia brevispora TaxID=194682 RepID=A0ACC1SRV2_9APHY|nr:hypothetical protein NM688_g5645 [Phlebia brevispora]
MPHKDANQDGIPNIIISRFLINLQQVSSERFSEMHGGASHPSKFSSVSFRVPSASDIIGNLGEPLASGDGALDDEDHQDDGAGSCEECSSGYQNRASFSELTWGTPHAEGVQDPIEDQSGIIVIS